MKITFGRFFRNTPATIMRCGPTFRLARTHPARARSSGSETLSRSRSLVGYTIDTHESEVFGSHSVFRPRVPDRSRVRIAATVDSNHAQWLRLAKASQLSAAHHSSR